MSNASDEEGNQFDSQERKTKGPHSEKKEMGEEDADGAAGKDSVNG